MFSNNGLAKSIGTWGSELIRNFEDFKGAKYKMARFNPAKSLFITPRKA